MSAESAALPTTPTWTKWVLALAGIYNLAWGLFVILFPVASFRFGGITPLNHPPIWQCIGMIVGVYGVGYLIAASDPFRHWPIVLVGLLGKLCGPIGFAFTAANGDLPWRWGVPLLTNDLLWWIPFTGILVAVYRSHERNTRTPQ